MEDKGKRGSKKEGRELVPLINDGGELEHILMFW